ncbi:MAG: hypothetical protein HZA67_09850 [Rhodospirillales bacterium]|nr:hypothetical protein [Rhodospirillales bacterium]
MALAVPKLLAALPWFSKTNLSTDIRVWEGGWRVTLAYPGQENGYVDW